MNTITTIKPKITASNQGDGRGVSVTYDSATTQYDDPILYDGVFTPGGEKVALITTPVVKPKITII